MLRTLWQPYGCWNINLSKNLTIAQSRDIFEKRRTTLHRKLFTPRKLVNQWLKIRNRGGCIPAISIVARIKEEIFVYYRRSRLEKNKLMLYRQNISTMFDGVGIEGRGVLSVPGVISRFYLNKGLKDINVLLLYLHTLSLTLSPLKFQRMYV